MIALRRWQLFIRERFPFVRHLFLILFLFLANTFVAFEQGPLKSTPLSFTIVLIVFFRLRIFDEIKDYENDCLVHPTRPLARGLIDVSTAKNVAFFLIGVELLLSLIISFQAFIGAIVVSVYSLLMYKEFFIGSWLRSKLATYAVVHTLISALIALFIFSCITGKYFWQAPRTVFFFAAANWMVFNVFEFGRKTFGKDEERDSVESYSKKFGSWGATLLVFSMALVAVGIAFMFTTQTLRFLFTLLVLFLMVYCLPYAFINSKKWASRFRFACSTFILLYNVILAMGFLL